MDHFCLSPTPGDAPGGGNKLKNKIRKLTTPFLLYNISLFHFYWLHTATNFYSSVQGAYSLRVSFLSMLSDFCTHLHKTVHSCNTSKHISQ